jgi:hypothetical protein
VSPIEIGPDGTPIVTNPDGTPANAGPEGDIHTTDTPFVVPTSEAEPSHIVPVSASELTEDEARGKNEQTPHTDKKENDALSDVGAPPLPHNLPPSIVPGVSSRDTASLPASEIFDEMPDPNKEERETLRAEKAAVLKEHLGQESNIPLNHPSYWTATNRLRILDRDLQDRAIVWGNRATRG